MSGLDSMCSVATLMSSGCNCLLLKENIMLAVLSSLCYSVATEAICNPLCHGTDAIIYIPEDRCVTAEEENRTTVLSVNIYTTFTAAFIKQKCFRNKNPAKRLNFWQLTHVLNKIICVCSQRSGVRFPGRFFLFYFISGMFFFRFHTPVFFCKLPRLFIFDVSQAGILHIFSTFFHIITRDVKLSLFVMKFIFFFK